MKRVRVKKKKKMMTMMRMLTMMMTIMSGKLIMSERQGHVQTLTEPMDVSSLSQQRPTTLQEPL